MLYPRDDFQDYWRQGRFLRFFSVSNLINSVGNSLISGLLVSICTLKFGNNFLELLIFISYFMNLLAHKVHKIYELVVFSL